MSVQAMAWAIDQQVVTDPAARHVLLVLGNFADSRGRNAFPSVATLARDTGLSERTVRTKLDILRGMGLITLGNQAIARAEISRADRRPTVYDIELSRGAVRAPRDAERGAADGANGVQFTSERGATVAPDPRAKASKSNIEPKTSRAREGAAERFAEFWGSYPRKIAEKEARKVWQEQGFDLRADEIISGVDRLKRDDLNWVEGRFIPSPANFLEGERWKDEPQSSPMRLSLADRAAHAMRRRDECDLPIQQFDNVITGVEYTREPTPAKSPKPTLSESQRESIAYARQLHHLDQIDAAECERRVQAALQGASA